MQDPLPTPGTIVWIRRRRWLVERAQASRDVVRIDVADRGDRATFLAPFDRPVIVDRVPRARRVRVQHALARCADLLARTWGARTVLSALDAHIALLPHQLEPALAVLGGSRRLLLADEVGLGKTIQAGLVAAELRRRQASLRALFIVPAGLRDQWRDELAARFDIECQVADRQELGDVASRSRPDENPWQTPGIWIASLDYVKQPHVFDGMPRVPWDLVVVDEAHDACGHSDRHAASSELCRRARHVMLLTATPHSGDADRFAALLSMGALDGIPDRIEIFRRTRSDLALSLHRRVRWNVVTPGEAEARALDALAAFERAVVSRAGVAKADAARLLLSVFRKRALSTMAALDRSLERRLEWLAVSEPSPDAIDWFQPRLGFDEEADGLGDADCAALSGDIGLATSHERAWLGRLRLLVRAAIGREHKVARLVGLVSRTGEPVVVFTEFRHSLEFLNAKLAPHRAVAVLHGGQPASERARELRRFTHGAATLLLATDVAGQGLNLQERARWVVSFELPWNPARLEQRVGRVDRIGQRRSVHATFLVSRHAAEAGLLARLARRVMSARRSLGEDAFADLVAVSESVIGAAILGVGPDPPEVPIDPGVSRRRPWERAGRALAKQLARKRVLASHWRAPDGRHPPRPGSATTSARPEFAARLSLDGLASIAIVDVPVLDAAGTLVERHALVLRLHHDGSAQAPGRANEPARQMATARLQPRLRRLRRQQREALARAVAVEHALVKHLRANRSPSGLQPGLFDCRALRESTLSDAETANRVDTAEARIQHWSARATLDVGQPHLEVVFHRLRREP